MTDYQIASKEAKKAEQIYQNALRSGNPDAIKQAEADMNNAKSTLEYYSADADARQGFGSETDFAKKVKEHSGMDKKDDKEQSTTPILSKSFYRGLIGSATGRPTGNEYDVTAQKARTASDNYKQSSAEHGAEAKQHQQIANRNEFSEAGKIASVQNAAQNQQNINNTSYAAGNAAALKRTTNAPDVAGQREYQAQQRSQAEQQRAAEINDRQMIGATANDALQYDIASRDYNDDLNTTNALSQASGNDTQSNNTSSTDSTDNDTQPTTKPDDKGQMPSGNPQHVMNALLGSSKGQDLRTGDTSAPDYALYQWALSQGVKPITPKSNDPNQWESEFIAMGPAYQKVVDMLRQGRAGEGNDAARNYSAADYDQMNQSMTVNTDGDVSDERVKNIKGMIDGSLMSFLRDRLSDGFCEHDAKLFTSLNKDKFKYNDNEYDMTQEADHPDDLINAYADYMVNYLYNYKPEATDIDPSIDTNEDHIGPMAQDIEKINPACIKETADGTKTVDTSRLALMNAGVIGDLARELKELKEVFLGK